MRVRVYQEGSFVELDERDVLTFHNLEGKEVLRVTRGRHELTISILADLTSTASIYHGEDAKT